MPVPIIILLVLGAYCLLTGKPILAVHFAPPKRSGLLFDRFENLQDFRNEIGRYIREYSRVGIKADPGRLTWEQCQRCINEYEKEYGK